MSPEATCVLMFPVTCVILLKPGHASNSRQGATTPGRDRAAPTFSMNKPEAVVHAMKVCFLLSIGLAVQDMRMHCLAQ